MRRITQRTQFRNDLRRQKHRGKNIEELIAAVELLAETGALPAPYRPHRLSGEWKGVWECHIEPDRSFPSRRTYPGSRPTARTRAGDAQNPEFRLLNRMLRGVDFLRPSPPRAFRGAGPGEDRTALASGFFRAEAVPFVAPLRLKKIPRGSHARIAASNCADSLRR